MSLRYLIWPLLIVPAANAPAQPARLSVTNDADRSELVFTIGPVDLPNGEHHAHGGQPPTQAVALPIGGFLHGFTTALYDQQGRKLPSVLLHHVNIMAPQRRELFSAIMQRVGAAGVETGPVMLPRLLGYPVSEGDSLVFTVMFHNPTESAYQDAELRIRMKYSTASALLPVIAVQPFYVDVMPPAGIHAYTLPAGRSSRSWEGSPAIPGRVLGLGGHMHKYGVALRFEDVTTGKLLWETKPAVDSAGNVVGVPRKFFFWQLGVSIQPSHTYRLTAEYDNPTGEAIEDGAMGTLGGIFVPDERAEWPALDREHPEYIADLNVMYPPGSGGGPQHHHR
ncbi:MAG: hypothetical protein ACT443_10450 [Gemmatimonadota bacterium]